MYLKYDDINNVYEWAKSQKLSLGSFKRVEETSQFNEGSTKSYNKDRDIRNSLEDNVQYLEYLHTDWLFLHGRMKIEKVEKPAPNLHNKKSLL